MPSVKLQPDTISILAALRGRLGCGHSYDRIIQELVHRHIHEVNAALLAPDRLERIEALLVQLLQKADDDAASAASSTPPATYTVE